MEGVKLATIVLVVALPDDVELGAVVTSGVRLDADKHPLPRWHEGVFGGIQFASIEEGVTHRAIDAGALPEEWPDPAPAEIEPVFLKKEDA